MNRVIDETLNHIGSQDCGLGVVPGASRPPLQEDFSRSGRDTALFKYWLHGGLVAYHQLGYKSKVQAERVPAKSRVESNAR